MPCAAVPPNGLTTNTTTAAMAATAASPPPITSAFDEPLVSAEREVCACESLSWPSRALLGVAGRGRPSLRARSPASASTPAPAAARARPAPRSRACIGRSSSAGGGDRVDGRRQFGGRLGDGRHVGLMRSGFAAGDRRRRLGGGRAASTAFRRPPAAAGKSAGAGGGRGCDRRGGRRRRHADHRGRLGLGLAGGARHQFGDDVRRGDQAGAGDGFVERGLRVDRRGERPAEAERARQPADDGRVQRLRAAVGADLLGAVQQRRERRRILPVVDRAAADQRQAEIAELIDVRRLRERLAAVRRAAPGDSPATPAAASGRARPGRRRRRIP